MKSPEIAQKMQERITGGEWKPGQKIPPQRRLARDFRVELAVVTEAVAMLRQHGYLKPNLGAAGTVVEPKAKWDVSFVPAEIPCRRRGCQQAPELAKLFGHSSAAHVLIGRLATRPANITTESQLRAIPDQDLMDIRGIGNRYLNMIREKVPHNGK